VFGEAAALLSKSASLLLGWRPDEFWNATPAELALALPAHDAATGGPDTEVIEGLKARFPDDADHGRPTNMKAAAPAMQAKAPR
jgi:hypothetical protein